MKLSVLLPTRNAAHLLESCVRSVLAQPTEKLELIVSDNASADGTQGVLDQFADDSRLRTIRQGEPVPVTENWRRALAASSGDYLLLIGDDDYVLPDYWERVEALLAANDYPEVLSYNGYAFAFPGALRDREDAHYTDPLFRGDPDLPDEGMLSSGLRSRLVRDVFGFEFGFCLNMQTTLVARAAVERLRNGPFHPPFPDFYAVSALLLTARSWLHSREKLVIVGISPKSFGSTLQGGADQRRGLPYLGITTEFAGSLPGNEMINGTHLTLEQLRRDFPDELGGLAVDRARYVNIQAGHWYLQWRLGSLRARDLARLVGRLSLRDWLLLAGALVRQASPDMVRRNLLIDRRGAAVQMWPGLRPAPGVQDPAGLARLLSGEPLRGSAKGPNSPGLP